MEQYHRAVGMFDGVWYTHTTCMTCSRIREDVCQGGWVFGQLRKTIWECFGVDYVSGETMSDEEESTT